jgi:hypothetical protein
VPRAEAITEMGNPLLPAMGVTTVLNFQATADGKAAITGDFVLIDTVGPNSQSYADTTCSPSTEYCYQVLAYNQYGTAWSPTACATTFSSEVPPDVRPASTRLSHRPD